MPPEEHAPEGELQAERAATFRLFIESVRDYAIFMLDPEGRVASWNEGAQRIKQYRRDEIVGRHFSVFYPPDAVARGWPEHELAVARREGRFEDEGWRVRKDGTQFWANVVITAVHDAEGRLRGFAKVTRDMTERRRAQEQSVRLAEQEAARAEAERANSRLHALVDVSRTLAEAGLDFDVAAGTVCRQVARLIGDGCLMGLVREGRLVRIACAHVDPEAERLLREAPADWVALEDSVVGRALREQVTLSPAGTMAAASFGFPDVADFFERFPVSAVMAAPMLLQGQAMGVLAAMRSGKAAYSDSDRLLVESLAFRAALALDNATLYKDLRQAHAQLRDALAEVTGISRMKDEFLATLSHELRTPLNSIVGWVQLLKTGGLTAEVTGKAIDTIARNANLQSQLIADILDVSGIVTGKMRLNVRPIEPARPIEYALDTLRPAAAAKGVRLQLLIDHSAGPISGDPERLQQIVWNLVSNAIKFAPKGGSVQVRLEAVDSHVEIVVEDDGPGIPEEFVPHVFERFRQADSSSTRGYKGLGLGLAIVRHLVELHGGQVRAANREVGTGAIFTVALSRRAVAASALAGDGVRHPLVGTDVPEPAPSLRGLRVMLVDDEEDARELLTEALGQAGAEVQAVSSASEVLEGLGQYRPHVLLADIEMPQADGYLLLRQVRQLDPANGGITPAIAITAYAAPEDRIRALSAGFDLHLAKPVQLAELVTAIARLAGQRRQLPGGG